MSRNRESVWGYCQASPSSDGGEAIMEDLNVDHASPEGTARSYAQTRKDVLQWRALDNVQYGFYIDVGAHDPTELSVTRAFYDRGRRGINVEPQSVVHRETSHGTTARRDTGGCAWRCARVGHVVRIWRHGPFDTGHVDRRAPRGSGLQGDRAASVSYNVGGTAG